jgi:hypothetical protein
LFWQAESSQVPSFEYAILTGEESRLRSSVHGKPAPILQARSDGKEFSAMSPAIKLHGIEFRAVVG